MLVATPTASQQDQYESRKAGHQQASGPPQGAFIRGSQNTKTPTSLIPASTEPLPLLSTWNRI